MNAKLNALLFSRMAAVKIPEPVDQKTCPHLLNTVQHPSTCTGSGRAMIETAVVRCDGCGAGQMATFYYDHRKSELRPFTALELHQYGEGPRKFTQEI